MKRGDPCAEEPLTISSDDSDSDSKHSIDGAKQWIKTRDQPVEDGSLEGTLLRRAKMYQEFMNNIPVPVQRSSVIPCTSWYGLGSSMKRLYCQPLHYLTNVLLKQWDQMRIGSDDEHEPLDVIIHPSKAEAVIWVAEEVHRLTASHHHLAKQWTLDPLYHSFIDPVVPNL